MARIGSRDSRPLVTVLGSSGFVGSAVLRALGLRPIRLRAVSRTPSVVPVGGLADIEVRTADLTVAGQLSDMVTGSDAVIHLVAHSAGWRAADSDPASEQVNVGVMGSLVEVLQACGGRRPIPVVFAGSSSQVGPSARMPIDGTEPDRPRTTYDRQKQAAEDALMTATAQGALRGISLRLPTVYGPGPAPGVGGPGVLSAMIGRALAGAPLTMWHDGTVERDLLHVDDVAAAFLAALDHCDALAGRHWPLGTGRGERLGDVFRAIAQIVSEHTGAAPVPVVSVPPPAHAAETDLRSVVVDCSAFRSATGWWPRVRLRAALRRIVIQQAAQ